MTRLEVTEQLVVEQAFKLVQAQEHIAELEARVVSECNRLNSSLRERDLRIAELENFVAVAASAHPDLETLAKELLAKGAKE